MLLTLTAMHGSVADMGYWFRKNPTRSQSFGLPFGNACGSYPDGTPLRRAGLLAVLLLALSGAAAVTGETEKQPGPCSAPSAQVDSSAAKYVLSAASVAQSCTLPSRGFLIRRLRQAPARPVSPTFCRLQVGRSAAKPQPKQLRSCRPSGVGCDLAALRCMYLAASCVQAGSTVGNAASVW